MYGFLQVISFLSLIFKNVLYIRMTINFKFNKLYSLQISELLQACFVLLSLQVAS